KYTIELPSHTCELAPTHPPLLPVEYRLQRLHLEGRRAERKPDYYDRGQQVPRVVDALREGPALDAHQEAAPPDPEFPEGLQDASALPGPPLLLLHDELLPRRCGPHAVDDGSEDLVRREERGDVPGNPG